MKLSIPGDEEEICVADHVRVTASWDWLTANRETKIAQYPSPKDCIPIGVRIVKHSCSNESITTRIVESGTEILSEEKIKTYYKDNIEAAYKDKNPELSAKLESDRDHHLHIYRNYKVNKDIVEVEIIAKAHGWALDRKRGWAEVSVYVKYMYIGLPKASSMSLTPNTTSGSINNESIQRNSLQISHYTFYKNSQRKQNTTEGQIMKEESVTKIV